MKISDKVLNINFCIEAIDTLNSERESLKNLLDYIVPVMLSAKKNLKKYQILYWNHKELRKDPEFIEAYESASETYELCKSRYNSICKLLKLNKITLKARQRDISKLNLN